MVKKELVLAIENTGTLSTRVIDEDALAGLVNVDTSWYIPRHIAEKDEKFVHIIPYTAIQRESDGKLLTYRRGKGGSEERLAGRWSIGVGGHIGLEDVGIINRPEDNTTLNSIAKAAVREIYEEFDIKLNEVFADTKALIYDDKDEVGRVHLGVLYIVEVPHSQHIRANEEIGEWQWTSIEELKKGVVNLESWSKIALDLI